MKKTGDAGSKAKVFEILYRGQSRWFARWQLVRPVLHMLWRALCGYGVYGVVDVTQKKERKA